jgi:adenosylmethionine---8-amino-7-oxononanoate aminotransferase
MKAPIEASPLAWLEAVERQRREAGLRRSLRPRPAVATELDLASNDYLGLSQHPGVIECNRPVDLAVATPAALDRGVWLRPFRNLVYAMPPFICPPGQIAQITSAMVEVARLVG